MSAPAVESREIVLDGQRVAYTLRRSVRKTLGLRIDQRGLTVGVPQRTGVREVEAFIRSCWDAGLEIGSSVRSVEECLSEAANDVTVQTSLLEARRICGDPALFARFEHQFGAQLDPHAFLVAKTLEMRQRHHKFENTPYSLAYYKREDIPLHFAVAEGWTMADNYHESVITSTSGWSSFTDSPTFTSQRTISPSTTPSPIFPSGWSPWRLGGAVASRGWSSCSRRSSALIPSCSASPCPTLIPRI